MAQDLSSEIALTEEMDARQGTSALKRCRDRILTAIRQGARLPDLLCVPLSVRGALLGLLHIHIEAAFDDRELEDLSKLATTVSESVKLVLSNLTLQETIRHQST